MKKAVSVLLLCFMLFSFAACRGGEEPESTGTYTYTPATSGADDTTGGSEGSEAFPVDASWHENFNVLFKYFDISQGKDPVTVNEKKGEGFFIAEYMETGSKLYYVQNGPDIDYYYLSSDLTGVRSRLKNKQMSSISTTFMKLSEVSGDLPTLANVMFMGEENVAGRPCRKYIQRAYQDGEAKQTVYVWVDEEYGFAARGEAYNEKDEMTVNWVLLRFSAGDVGEDSGVSLGAYEIRDA